jgi:citrate synthase
MVTARVQAAQDEDTVNAGENMVTSYRPNSIQWLEFQHIIAWQERIWKLSLVLRESHTPVKQQKLAPAATMESRATMRPAKLMATSETVTRPTPNMTTLMLAMTGVEKFLL